MVIDGDPAAQRNSTERWYLGSDRHVNKVKCPHCSEADTSPQLKNAGRMVSTTWEKRVWAPAQSRCNVSNRRRKKRPCPALNKKLPRESEKKPNGEVCQAHSRAKNARYRPREWTHRNRGKVPRNPCYQLKYTDTNANIMTTIRARSAQIETILEGHNN